jgi:hypothetical protein
MAAVAAAGKDRDSVGMVVAAADKVAGRDMAPAAAGTAVDRVQLMMRWQEDPSSQHLGQNLELLLVVVLHNHLLADILREVHRFAGQTSSLCPRPCGGRGV